MAFILINERGGSVEELVENFRRYREYLDRERGRFPSSHGNLSRLALPDLCPVDEPYAAGRRRPTTWKIVVKYAAALFSRDNLVVVGGRADWCLYYHHDDVLTFARAPDFAKVAW